MVYLVYIASVLYGCTSVPSSQNFCSSSKQPLLLLFPGQWLLEDYIVSIQNTERRVACESFVFFSLTELIDTWVLGPSSLKEPHSLEQAVTSEIKTQNNNEYGH